MRGDWPRRRSLWRDRGQLHAKVSASAMTCSKIGRFMRRGHCTMACLGCQAVCAVAAGASGAVCAPSAGPRGARRGPFTCTRTAGSPSSPNSSATPCREGWPSGRSSNMRFRDRTALRSGSSRRAAAEGSAEWTHRRHSRAHRLCRVPSFRTQRPPWIVPQRMMPCSRATSHPRLSGRTRGASSPRGVP